MKILIQNGRVIDPASGLDQTCDIALAAGRIMAIGRVAQDFAPHRTIDATGCIVLPGLVDLAARLREPGYEHEGMLESEMAAAVAGGVTSLVCPPDTDDAACSQGNVAHPVQTAGGIDHPAVVDQCLHDFMKNWLETLD